MNFKVSMVVVVQLTVIFWVFTLCSCSNISENVTTRNHYNQLWNAKIIFSCVIMCDEYSNRDYCVDQYSTAHLCLHL